MLNMESTFLSYITNSFNFCQIEFWQLFTMHGWISLVKIEARFGVHGGQGKVHVERREGGGGLRSEGEWESGRCSSPCANESIWNEIKLFPIHGRHSFKTLMQQVFSLLQKLQSWLYFKLTRCGIISLQTAQKLI